jgi:APA family basic amino acid/polyamine antiporter
MALSRSLGLRSAIMLVVGNVVGAGIFTTGGFLASEISLPAAYIGAWVLGGLLTLCGALTYAELGAMFPRAGGDYQFLKEAYGPLAGFLLGWISFWVISPGSTAALAIALAGYLPPVVSDDSTWCSGAAVLVVIIFTGINFRSTRLAGIIQNLVTAASLLLLGALVIGGALWGTGDAGNFSTPAPQEQGASIFSGAAMIAVVFTYSGWFAAAYLGAEIKQPERNVPLALILGTLIVTGVYVAVNAIYLYAIPLTEMRGATNVAQLAAQRLFTGPVAVLVSWTIVLAIGSCINATLMTGARICYAMAADGLMPELLGRVHPRYGTPHVAVLAQGLIALALVLAGTFERLLAYVVFAMLLSSIAAGLAHIVLRHRRPDAPRPYRTALYPALPIIFVTSYIWIAVSVIQNKTLPSLIGLALVISGVPFYFAWKRLTSKRA